METENNTDENSARSGRLPDAAAQSIDIPNDWSMFKRLSFRFAFVYFPVFFFGYFWARYQCISLWIAKDILHSKAEFPVYVTDTGDGTFAHIVVALLIVFSIVATCVWSILDRNRKEYRRLHECFRIVLSMILGFILLLYGIGKQVQFPVPSDLALQQSFGDSSPMRLLWNFMGCSPPYCLFAEAMEVIAGVLVMIPFVRTLGALVAMAVMLHIFVLNLCYDVPVKIFAFHLLLMSIVLLLPDCKRLSDVFVFNRAVPIRQMTLLFKKDLLNRVVWGSQLLFLLFSIVVISLSIHPSIKAHHLTYVGVWNLDQKKSQFADPSMEFTQIAFGRLYAETFDSKRMLHTMYAIQPVNKNKSKTKIEIFSLEQNRKVGEYEYRLSDQALVLDGKCCGKSAHLEFWRAPKKTWNLMARSFRWIQEYPDMPPNR